MANSETRTVWAAVGGDGEAWLWTVAKSWELALTKYMERWTMPEENLAVKKFWLVPWEPGEKDCEESD